MFSAEDVAALVASKSVDTKNREGYAPLHLACLAGDVKSAQLLVREGAASLVNEDAKRRMPLHCAAISGSEPLCSLLIDALDERKWVPRTILMRDEQQFTPLHHAIRARGGDASLALMQLLVRRAAASQPLSAAPELAPAPGRPGLLHCAAAEGREGLLELLLEHGAEVEATDVNFGGRRALACAAAEGHLGAVKLLARAGADRGAADDEGLAAAEWAEMMEHELVCAWLRNPPDAVGRGSDGEGGDIAGDAKGGNKSPASEEATVVAMEAMEAQVMAGGALDMAALAELNRSDDGAFAAVARTTAGASTTEAEVPGHTGAAAAASASQTPPRPPPAAGGGGGLWEGEVDEAKEAEDFAAAVLAWRSAGAGPVAAAAGAASATAASTAAAAPPAPVRSPAQHPHAAMFAAQADLDREEQELLGLSYEAGDVGSAAVGEKEEEEVEEDSASLEHLEELRQRLHDSMGGLSAGASQRVQTEVQQHLAHAQAAVGGAAPPVSSAKPQRHSIGCGD